MIDLVVYGSFVALGVLTGKAVHLLATRRPMVARTPALKWGEGAVLCACAGLPIYVFSLFVGFGQSSSEACAAQSGRRAGAYVGYEESLFPRSGLCHWADGTSTDLVPVWVNPLIFSCIAGAVLCAAFAIRAAVRQKETLEHE
ncbi:hypothetical protein [Amycolatopsis cihanbeyliensis]|uniref:Uncharacterized protein n=1 Tax=Amycolatopsis cihanbeyliensis TaxID=1128664 RepID=A0A542DLE6_AMYCI|nr:hypothetical protein [Amycolatopsis cihanbeyliensis]TQJ03907.1 hypothetical protein FB471_3681 [Amycolatopsis cihanbeyliensis]